MGISGRNRIVTFACVVCSVGCNAAEFLVRWDLVEQIWQNGRIPDTTTRDLDGTDLQRLLVYPNMYLAPQAAFGTAVLAGIPLAFPFSLDTRAVDKQVQWSC